MLVDRRTMLLMAVALAWVTPARAEPIEFLYNEGCGCCHKWAAMMGEAGMPVTFTGSPDLLADHERFGIPADLAGCHVGRISGYVVSGHVPPADILRLLKEKPEAVGLAVPGMPMGSPGMEYQGQIAPYAVLLVKADGTTGEFARYG